MLLLKGHVDERAPEERELAEDKKKRAPAFAKILFEMARENRAFHYEDRYRTTFYLVIEGRYAGLWKYSSNRGRGDSASDEYYQGRGGRTDYQWDLLHLDRVEQRTKEWRKEHSWEEREKLKRWVNIPLPAFCYNDARKFHIEHKENREFLSKVLMNWRKFRSGPYDRFYRRVHAVCNLLNFREETDSHVQLGRRREAVAICYAMARPELFQQLGCNPTALRHKIEWLAAMHKLVDTIGVRKRQRFVRNVIVHGPKYAMRRSFPLTHRRTLNEIISLEVGEFVFATTLSSWRGNARYKALSYAEYICRYREDAKRMKPVLIKVAERYGKDALNKFSHFLQEYENARAAGIDVSRYNIYSVQDGHTYEMWHDRVSDLLGHHRRIQRQKDEEDVEQKYKTLWASVELPPNIKPLIKQKDFTQESVVMGHCIKNYFFSDSSIYAHIDLGEEKASVEIGVQPHRLHVAQLRGIKNAAPSAAMSTLVYQFVNDKLAPALVGTPFQEKDYAEEAREEVEEDIPF